MQNLPVENLLRPAVEIWPAITSAAVAAAMALAPDAMMLPPDVGLVGAALFGAWALKRGLDARRVLRYRRNLRRLEHYALRPEQIPVSKHKLFLGRGFRWTQTHTQRLMQTRDPALQQFFAQPAAYRWARKAEIRFERSKLLGWLPELTRSGAWWNPVPPLPLVGGNPAIHGIEPDEDDVFMDLSERGGHTLVLGTTGCGKTRFLEMLVTQDIHRGETVIVFDPKGDAELIKRMYAEAVRCGRDKDFLFFHLGYPEISARYNPIGSFGRPTEPATRIADQLPGEGDSAAFRQFAWRFTNIVVRALISLGRRPDYMQIARYVTSIEPLLIEYLEHWLGQSGPDGWQDTVRRIEASFIAEPKTIPPKLKDRDLRAIALVRYLRDSGLYDPVADGLRNAWEYDTTYYGKITASLLPLLEKLTTGRTTELLVPEYGNVDDPRPIFSWKEVIRRKCIVYIGLDALSDYEVAGAIGNAMFADLTSVAGDLYKFGADGGLPGGGQARARIAVHADEFNELIGPAFVPLLNKARGAGFQVTAYTQTWSDVEARVGSKARAGQVGGNFNTLVMLRVKNTETAQILTDQLPKARITSLVTVSGVTDGHGFDESFTSKNEDRIQEVETELLMPADLTSLPKGQAFALLEGGILWKLRLPLASSDSDHCMPDSLLDVVRRMRERRSGELSELG